MKIVLALRKGLCWLLLAGLCLAPGCATDGIEARRQDHWLAYSALPQESRELVDQGKIRSGMSQDAVFIAWGKPLETLEVESSWGHVSIWRYGDKDASRGNQMYRETYRNTQPVLERLRRQKNGADARGAVEIEFRKDRVVAWRLVP